MAMAKALLFAPLSNVSGTEALQVALSEDVKTVADLIGFLHPPRETMEKYLHTEKRQLTFSRQFRDTETTITNTDKIAPILPPHTI